MRKVFFLIVLLSLLHLTLLYANTEHKDSVGGEPLQDIVVISQNDWLIIPHLYYKPETQFAYGVVFLTYFQDIIMSIPPIKLRPTTLAVTFTHTQNDQFIFQVFPEFYFLRDRYHIKNEFQYMNYPDKFYGIGQETTDDNKESYTSRIFSFKNIIERALIPGFYIGLLYHIDVRKTTQAEEGGVIDTNQVPGSDKGRVSGLGITVNFDNRDDILFTRDGSYANLTITQYSKYIKSDFDYIDVTFDYRFFEPFWFSHVLAVQFFSGYIHGQAPFYLLSQMGGAKLMRGLYEGRFRDRNVVVVQAEYRVPLFWRFSGCGFGGAGQVAPTLRDFNKKHIVYTWGGGLRFKIKKEQSLNIRLDVGFSKNFYGVYVTIGEAI
ncbi:MAG: outer membrane protein assembly factor [Spirochaetes bacterium]|nr:outer membrane protein assembly factor [Spirochaetota bacterium]